MAFSLAAIQKAQKRRRAAVAPSLPPLGSFDPSLLLQYNANARAAQDAQDQYDLGAAQAQDNFGIQTSRIGTQLQQAQQDTAQRSTDLAHQYGTLAHQQAQGALQRNVESAGILQQALARRQANSQHDQALIDTAMSRTKQQADWQKSDLALNLARAFGSGRNGQPLGTNTLNLIQTKNNATGGNLDLSQAAYLQAAAAGYSPPRRKPRVPMVI